MSAPPPNGQSPNGQSPNLPFPPGWYREGASEIERFWDGEAWTTQRRLGGRPLVATGRDKIRWAGVAWGAARPELSLALGILVALLGLPMLILLPLSVSALAGVMNGAIGVALVLIGVVMAVDASFGFRLRHARRPRP